jgi:hypothetical protein
MKKRLSLSPSTFCSVLLAGLLVSVSVETTNAQTLSSFDRQRGHVMLNSLKNEVGDVHVGCVKRCPVQFAVHKLLP